eukprot:TRINITY_DN31534_c0_g1_i1.p1 TRINITY_DN31534_c0_g1~~TRINITY_DN31534_c0_g1_i1.p1  ORF type:complete len:773 (+),score=150.07 TRINITY_DN31534_c0_g1_i1:50-2368(+)
MSASAGKQPAPPGIYLPSGVGHVHSGYGTRHRMHSTTSRVDVGSGHRRAQSQGCLLGWADDVPSALHMTMGRTETTPQSPSAASRAAPEKVPKRYIPFSLRLCASLGVVWLAIQLLTSYPSLFLMFCYPVLFAAILEPMKVALWKVMWLVLVVSFSFLSQAIVELRENTFVERWKERLQSLVPFLRQIPVISDWDWVKCEMKSQNIPLAQAAVEQELAIPPDGHDGALKGEGDTPTSTGTCVPGPTHDAETGLAGTVVVESRTGRKDGYDTLPEFFPDDGRGAGAADERPRRSSTRSAWSSIFSSTVVWYAELAVKKVLLFLSIFLCLMTAGRIVVILGRIVLGTAEQIASDFPHYQKGAELRMKSLRDWIAQMTEAKLGRRMELPVNVLIVSEQFILEHASPFAVQVSQYMFQQVVPQTCMTTLFLVFLLWNPVKAEGQRKEIIELCFDYVKVKSVLSTSLGFLVGFSLYCCDLELYYAAGLLVAVANFVPNGALLCSVFPCIFALFDDRKWLSQVITALIVQICLINFFAFLVEPLFFGAAIEMHPIPAILGVTFFGYLWGIPGMMISIPILGAFRLMLAAWAKRAADEDVDAIVAMQDFLEGRWTTPASLGLEDEEKTGIYHERSASAFVEETCDEDGPGLQTVSTVDYISRSYRSCALRIRESYARHKVVIDGLFYLGMVYFLFSSWSDRVFGLNEPGAGGTPAMDQVLTASAAHVGNSTLKDAAANISVHLGAAANISGHLVPEHPPSRSAGLHLSHHLHHLHHGDH